MQWFSRWWRSPPGWVHSPVHVPQLLWGGIQPPGSLSRALTWLFAGASRKSSHLCYHHLLHLNIHLVERVLLPTCTDIVGTCCSLGGQRFALHQGRAGRGICRDSLFFLELLGDAQKSSVVPLTRPDVHLCGWWLSSGSWVMLPFPWSLWT